MPFPDSGTYPLSNKDLLSFTFDDPTYDIDKPIYLDPENPTKHFYTYRSSLQTVKGLIAGLKQARLQPGDTVLIHSFNSLVYPLLILGIVGAGGKSVGTNPGYTPAELQHGVKLAKAKFVFAEPEILPNMLRALEENGIDASSNLFILDTLPGQRVPPGYRSWKTLHEHGEADWHRFDHEETSRDTVAQLYYTSGTTGLPKCAQTTHKNLVAQHQLFYEAHPRSYPYRVVLCMPFFHVGVAPQVFVSVLKEGREAYIMRRFDLKSYLSYHPRYQITETFIVPPMVVAIVMSGLADEKSDNHDPKYSLRSVRNGTVGAAPCSPDIQKRFASLLGDGATFSQVWGMTETTSMAAIVPWDIARKCTAGEIDAWGNVGRPLPCMSMKLVDARGSDITHTGKGELCVRGPTIVKGYFENERATRESLDSEGYFRTGDVIQVDKHGLMHVVERMKELIKVRGFQVAPAELEGALTEHPHIVDAAVIGVRHPEIPHDEDVEAPRGYVVKREGVHLTEDHVHEHMRERLAGYKQLHGGVHFVDEVPKSPSGKILRRVLREKVKEEEKAKKTRPKL